MKYLVILLLTLGACEPKTPPSNLSAEAAAAAAQAAALRAQIRELWNYEDPGVSGAKFLEAANAAPDALSRDQLMTQHARAKGLLGNYGEANAILDAIENPQGVVKLRVILERGRVLRNAGDEGEALYLFRDAWELGRQLGEDNLAVDAAHMAAISSKLEYAIGWTETGLSVAHLSTDPDAKLWIGPLTNNLGWSYYESDRFEEALAIWEDSLAWHQSEQTGQGERIARYTVGVGMRSLGRYEEALELQLAVLVDTKENREATGYIHEELGENYLALGKTTQAQRHFAKAYATLKLDVHMKTKERARLARIKELAEQ